MSFADDPELRRSLQRWKVAGVASLLGLALLFPLSRAVDASSRASAREQMQRGAIALGREVFATNCAKCHGEQGQGVDSPALNSSQFFEEATAERISGLATVGIPGTAMPAWSQEFGGPLTDEQLHAVAAFIMTWKADAPDVPDWRTKFLGTPPPMPMGGSMPGMDMGTTAHDPTAEAHTTDSHGTDTHTDHDHQGA